MTNLNNAIDIQIIERHLKLKVDSTNLQDLLNAIAVKLNSDEQKILDLKHEIDLKDKSIARLAGLSK